MSGSVLEKFVSFSVERCFVSCAGKFAGGNLIAVYLQML